MMDTIFKYKDFRKYMQDFYDFKKRTAAFTWRDFSKLAGFVSPVYLKEVCVGNANLSKRGIPKVVKALGLSGREASYFESLVVYCQSKKDVEKRDAYLNMLSMAKDNEIHVLGSDAFKFYDSWVHSVVRELAPAMPGASANQIAKRCHQHVSAKDVENSLAFLLQSNLLKKTDDGYEQTQKHLMGSPQDMGLAIRSMNRQMAVFAERALDAFSTEERNITGITMGLSQNAYEKVVGILQDCRNRILEVVTDDDCIDRVYRLNLQLFPLTKNVKDFVEKDI